MAIWDWENPGTIRWAFVVDTSDYAGNFERELSVYVVGRCDMETEELHDRTSLMYDLFEADFPKKSPFEDLVTTRVDDHGDDHIARSPMALAPTPGKKGKYNSVAIFLDRKPDDRELALLVERSRRFPEVCERGPKRVIACRLVAERTSVESHQVWRA